MVARIINGRSLAAALNVETAGRAAAFKEAHGRMPGLAVILVGSHAPSEIYVRMKVKAAEKAGIAATIHRFEAAVSPDTVGQLIDALNGDERVQGILIQLPLPEGWPTLDLLNRIDPQKDIDGLSLINAGRRGMGLPCHLPCTPKGAMRLIRSVQPDLTGLHAVVIGRSDLVGKPMAQLLLAADCSVTHLHKASRDIPALCRRADIIVVAVGQSGLVKADWVKPGAIVIDVGINRAADSTLSGDVAFEEVSKIAGFITPVPGGVGPMTVACLLENCVAAGF